MKLQGRILLFTFAVLAFFGLLLVVFMKTEFSARLTSELQKRGISIARHIAEESVAAILAEDALSLRLIARNRMQSEEDIIYVLFLNGEGTRVLSHSFGETFPFELLGVNGVAPDGTYAIRSLATEYGLVHDIAVPVLTGGLGQVRVGLSAEAIEASVKTITTEVLSLTAVMLLLAGVAAIPLSQAVTQPIRRLTGAAEEIAAGRLDREVAVDSRDEVGELAASFNRMVYNLKVARKELEDAARLRDEFISMAVHEFQTPLTAILGFSDLLTEQERDLTPEQKREFLAIIGAKAQFLSRIVNELLDVSRIEAGHGMAMHHEPCRIGSIIGEAVQMFRRRSPRHRFVLDLPDDDAELVLDPERVTQVLENLLSNAVKYSPKGGTIRIGAERRDGFYQVHIEDEGMGMTQQELARIFDKFYRVDTSHTAPAGTGLGLYIVKSIVEAHGGAVTISSAPGKGTRVEFTLAQSLRPAALQAAAG